MSDRPRTLITGVAGFLGSHLADRLLAEGHFVIGADDMITGEGGNIEHLQGNANFRMLYHDVTTYIDVKGPLDYVLHFASPASPIDYQKLPIQTLKVGALGTHNALGVAKDKNATFLLASSSEVYGDPLLNPQSEDYWGNVNPIGPRGVYDEAKRFAEALALAYQRTHNLRVRIARIFNTFGPRMRLDDGRAVPAFITQALANQPVTVFGDGTQTRSFCYISDMVEGICRLLTSSVEGPVNLGNPDEIPVSQIAEEIVALTGSKSKLVYQPLPEDDPKVRRPDIARAQQLLDWQPRIPRTEGLKETIAYFRERLAVR